MGAYVPFYLMYYVLMALEIQFAETAIGITRRYQRLNTAIRNIFAISKSFQSILYWQFGTSRCFLFFVERLS